MDPEIKHHYYIKNTWSLIVREYRRLWASGNKIMEIWRMEKIT